MHLRPDISNLLLLPFMGDVALLDVPVAQKVSEVAKYGEDAVAHVGEHRHQQRGLLKRLGKRLLIQTGVWGCILALRDKKQPRGGLDPTFIQASLATLKI